MRDLTTNKNWKGSNVCFDEINYLAETIRLHKTYNKTSMVVDSLSGTQRAFLDDIGLTYVALHDCCRIFLSPKQ
jgi:hypothetical protein